MIVIASLVAQALAVAVAASPIGPAGTNLDIDSSCSPWLSEFKIAIDAAITDIQGCAEYGYLLPDIRDGLLKAANPKGPPLAISCPNVISGRADLCAARVIGGLRFSAKELNGDPSCEPDLESEFVHELAHVVSPPLQVSDSHRRYEGYDPNSIDQVYGTEFYCTKNTSMIRKAGGPSYLNWQNRYWDVIDGGLSDCVASWLRASGSSENGPAGWELMKAEVDKGNDPCNCDFSKQPFRCQRAASTVIDFNGYPVANQGFTSDPPVSVEGPSNTALITLDGPTAYDPVSFNPGDDPSANFDDLSTGTYVAHLFDRGNRLLGVSTFTISPAYAIALDPPLGQASAPCCTTRDPNKDSPVIVFTVGITNFSTGNPVDLDPGTTIQFLTQDFSAPVRQVHTAIGRYEERIFATPCQSGDYNVHSLLWRGEQGMGLDKSNVEIDCPDE